MSSLDKNRFYFHGNEICGSFADYVVYVKPSISDDRKKEWCVIFSKGDGYNIESKNNYEYHYINDENIQTINSYLRLATEFNNKSYKYWHKYAMFNYKCYKDIYNYSKCKKDFYRKYQDKILIL